MGTRSSLTVASLPLPYKRLSYNKHYLPPSPTRRSSDLTASKQPTWATANRLRSDRRMGTRSSLTVASLPLPGKRRSEERREGKEGRPPVAAAPHTRKDHT